MKPVASNLVNLVEHLNRVDIAESVACIVRTNAEPDYLEEVANNRKLAPFERYLIDRQRVARFCTFLCILCLGLIVFWLVW